MTCWLLWLYDPEAVWLSALGLLRNWQCITIQYTGNLAELAYGCFKVRDPLGWDVLYALKLLACLLQKFGGIIDFTGSGLAQGQLSNRLCKAMDSGIFHRSRSFHTTGPSNTQGLQ